MACSHASSLGQVEDAVLGLRGDLVPLVERLHVDGTDAHPLAHQVADQVPADEAAAAGDDHKSVAHDATASSVSIVPAAPCADQAGVD